MYDEPRRAAVTQAIKNLNTKKSRSKTNNNKQKSQQPPTKKARKPAPKIIEETSSSSSSSSSSESESEREAEDKEAGNDRNINNKIAATTEDMTTTTKGTEENLEEATTASTTEDIINNLIMLEHNYFEPLPTAVHAPRYTDEHNKLLGQSAKTGRNDKINERKAVKRRSTTDSPEKGELKYKFKMRTKEEEERVIWNVYDDVIDSEDLSYMKEAFESLQQVASKEIESFNWDDLTCIFSFSFILLILFL